jgi:hypothetical protein
VDHARRPAASPPSKPGIVMTDSGGDPNDLAVLLTRFIVNSPGLALRLLEHHTADRNGYCTGCTHAQAGWHVAPCTIAVIARRAHDHETRPRPR